MIPLNFSSFPKINTERLLLRSLQPSDAHEIFALRSDDNINKYIERSKAKSIEEAEEFIEKIMKSVANRETLFWVIETKENKAFAGTFLLWNIDKEKNKAEIGYELLPQYHGKGIMHEAAKAVLAFAFGTLKFGVILAVVHKHNIASLNVIRRYNFVFRKALDENMMEYELSAANFNAAVKIQM